MPGETQVFPSSLDGRGGVIIFASISTSVWGMMTLTYFPQALGTFSYGLCDGYVRAVSLFPQGKKTWRIACNAASTSLHFTLLKMPVSVTNRLQDTFLGVYTTRKLPFYAECNYQQVRTSHVSQAQGPAACPYS